MPRVYVGIGSNIEREKNIQGAVRALRDSFGDVGLSPVYQSRADGFDGEDFYNLVATFVTDLPLEALRQSLVRIEDAHGRVRTSVRYGPRTLDIDILLYGDLVRHDGQFDVPRAEILRQAYVLRPLAELAPDARHPETRERFADLWQRYGATPALQRVALDL